MVAIPIAVGLVAAVTVAAPPDVPAIALRSASVYRVEVGAAVFLGLYIAMMVFAEPGVHRYRNRRCPRARSGDGFRARLTTPRWKC
jgi:hypothetical protein